MTEEIIIAGFGGQGVLSMGMILCYSGIMENKEVSWNANAVSTYGISLSVVEDIAASNT